MCVCGRKGHAYAPAGRRGAPQAAAAANRRGMRWCVPSSDRNLGMTQRCSVRNGVSGGSAEMGERQGNAFSHRAQVGSALGRRCSGARFARLLAIAHPEMLTVARRRGGRAASRGKNDSLKAIKNGRLDTSEWTRRPGLGRDRDACMAGRRDLGAFKAKHHDPRLGRALDSPNTTTLQRAAGSAVS